MNINLLFSFAITLSLVACASAGKEGDACTSDDDCKDGLECHIDEHDDHGDEDDHGDDHDDHGDEEGVCEEAGAHEDE